MNPAIREKFFGKVRCKLTSKWRTGLCQLEYNNVSSSWDFIVKQIYNTYGRRSGLEEEEIYKTLVKKFLTFLKLTYCVF